MPQSPSMNSPTISLPELVHSSADADVFRSGVRLRGSPPAIGRRKTSPPMESSSLIRPLINATDFPSGETAGRPICREGLKIEFIFSADVSTEKSSATYQLLSPLPLAAVSRIVLLSGAQSYS